MSSCELLTGNQESRCESSLIAGIGTGPAVWRKLSLDSTVVLRAVLFKNKLPSLGKMN